MTTLRQYPIFVDNQVLTKSQLNDLFKYLDQQNRLSTNVALIGIGIVCGLEVNFTEGPDEISISKGVGVTSEGYVIKVKGCTTSRYKAYTLPDEVEYEPFMSGGDQDLELFELLTESEAETAEEEGDEVLVLDKDFLLDKIVMLFLECFDHNKTSCLGKSCDELGTDRILRLRKLLISEEDLLVLLDRTNGGFTIAERLNAEWEKLAMPRVHFAENDDVSYISFILPYLLAIHKVKNKVYDILNQTYTGWEKLYRDIYGSNPFQSTSVLGVKSQVDDFLTGGVVPVPFNGIQYVYDFFKDLILAYDEYVRCACSFITECCPDTNLFEKHLFLGRAVSDPDETEYRHVFTASPALDLGNRTRAKLLKYHKRLVDLCGAFNISRFGDEAVETDLKITPSCEKKSKLSQRTIPYYYLEDSTLEESWRFGKCSEKYLLSYHKHDFQSGPDTPVKTPLHFDIDDYNFLRIEGALSKKLDDAEAIIDTFRVSRNLPFKLESVYLGETNGGLHIPDCVCTDLQISYATWRHKTLYFLRTLSVLMRRSKGVVLKRNQYMDSVSTFTKADKKSSDAASEERAFRSAFKQTMASASTIAQGAKLFTLRDEFDTIEKKQDITIAEAVQDNPANIAAQLIQGYVDCLRDLIKSMVIDLKKFNMDVWVEKYVCLLKYHINMMKAAVALVENANQQATVYIILLFYCVLYELLAILAIYPYIGLGTIMDILKERIRLYKEQYNLGRFNTVHPGLEHQAGAPFGGTFVLVYANALNRDDISEQDFEIFKKLGVDIDEIFKTLLEVLDGRVVGDFALPYMCCDPCASMENAARPLTPLAVPKCGIVRVKRGSSYVLANIGATTISAVRMRMIPHVYDVEAFEVDLSPVDVVNSGPQFGNVSFIERPAREDVDKLVQHLVYELDFEKINAALVTPGEDFFLVDEFGYRILDKSTREILGESSIHIFIPVVDRTVDDQTTTVFGIVADQAGNPIPGVNVTILRTTLGAITNASGNFVFGNVPLGQQSFQVQGFGITHTPQTFNVIPDMGQITLVVGAAGTDVDLSGFVITNTLTNILEVQPGTSEENLLKKKFIRKFNSSNKTAERIAAEGEETSDALLTNSATLIKEYSSKERVTINRLNSSYSKQRDRLLASIKAPGNTRVEKQTEALQSVTKAYLDRLVLLQSGGLSNSSKKVLTDTARAFNSTAGIEFARVYSKWISETEGAFSNQMKTELETNFKIKSR